MQKGFFVMTKNEVDLSQNNKTLQERLGQSLNNNKLSILGAILIVFLFTQIKFLFPDLDILGNTFALLAIWLISRLKKVGWSDLGLYRPKSWSKTIIVAIVTVVIVQAVAILQFSLSEAPDYSAFEQGLTLGKLLGLIVISWTTAAFAEEIIWRGFFMKQIARLFDEQKSSSWVIGLILTSVGFGLIHSYQGPAGMLGIGFVGLVYGIVYLAFGRNLWVTIIAHGLTGTSSFILLYFSQNQ